MEVGQGFSIRTQNTRTITSGNAEGVETWEISDINSDDITCELISTNMSMYAGGYFRVFTQKEINKYLHVK
tara:strand:+ start:28 stop:240 length:213 start_codon:yes stop_codon:yes gene_type:complete